jgi:hypothetical protein
MEAHHDPDDHASRTLVGPGRRDLELASIQQSKAVAMRWVLILLVAVAACVREAPETITEVPVPNGGIGGTTASTSTRTTGGTRPAETDAGNDASVPLGPRLTDEHQGYWQALCFDCHGGVAPYPHTNSNYRPPDCVACHGFNGSPHRDHAVIENPGCPDCHRAVAHVPKFTAPSDCVRCHNQS